MTGPQIIRLVIAVPTTTNKLHCIAGGRARNSRQYQDWKELAGKEILAQRPRLQCRSLPVQPYDVQIRIAVSDRGDIDNRAKALLDLLHEMRLTPDDGLLYDLRITRSPEVPIGVVHVIAKVHAPEVAAP